MLFFKYQEKRFVLIVWLFWKWRCPPKHVKMGGHPWLPLIFYICNNIKFASNFFNIIYNFHLYTMHVNFHTILFSYIIQRAIDLKFFHMLFVRVILWYNIKNLYMSVYIPIRTCTISNLFILTIHLHLRRNVIANERSKENLDSDFID